MRSAFLLKILWYRALHVALSTFLRCGKLDSESGRKKFLQNVHRDPCDQEKSLEELPYVFSLKPTRTKRSTESLPS